MMTKIIFLRAGFIAVLLLSQAVEAAPADHMDVAAMYEHAMLVDGNLKAPLARLSKIADGENHPKGDRVQALLAISNLHWRYGNRGAALKAIDRALELDATGDVLLQKARLVDSTGDALGAKDWYEKALSRMTDRAEAGDIRLRLTLMDRSDFKAFSIFAKTKDETFQNRAAVALAVMDHHEEAIGLFTVTGEKKDIRLRNQLRLSEWAIRAKNAPLAQKEAWQAVKMSDQERDQRYTLSLLVEAHRLDDSLDKLIIHFENQHTLTTQTRLVWIDLLREKHRFTEALRLFKAGGLDNFDVGQRRQLIRMYQEAGQEEQMVAEYRQLIHANPAQVNGYAGLGEYYVVIGRADEAEQLWQNFLTRNKENAAVLMQGAEVMSEMGFDRLAVQGLETYMMENGEEAPLLFFLYELRKRQGRMESAEDILGRIDRMLGSAAAERVDLAYAYEQLNKLEKSLAIWEGLAKTGGGIAYDEKMRLARLYARLDQWDQALELWQELWHEVTSPARRSFVEDRLMTLAAELGRLGDMVVGLEDKLAKGTASRIDSGLLVRIYTSVADQVSAIEVIDEYFDKSLQTESLREQSKVYRLLEDSEAFEKVMWKLTKTDPENKAEYLRSIILSQVDATDQPAGQKLVRIRKLLKELRAIDEDAVGGEFEAGVLVLAGLEDEGVKAYRQAMAADPEQGDNYLLLADLLKKQKREDEAITLLQYLAETTRQDNLFVVAIDGIVNMLTTEVFSRDGPKEGKNKLLKWAQRIILERLTGEVDKSYLYRILSDVSDELADGPIRLSATENTLVLSNNIRATILRQLISMTAAPDSNDFDRMIMMRGRAGRTEDPERHMAYGRRLVALNEELPPEVYTDLGKAFLAEQDPEGAMKAFNRALDITGRTDVMAQTAKFFDDAGYDEDALSQYNRALIRDKDNIFIMLKLAKLRERGGKNRSANVLYMKALHLLMRRQPLTRRVGGEAITREYKDYYKSLLAGALGTWPENPSLAGEKLFALQSMMQEELGRIIGGGNATDTFKNHARLGLMASLLRRISLGTGRSDFADRSDILLLQHFGDDEEFVIGLVKGRMAWDQWNSADRLAKAAGNLPDKTISLLKTLYSPGQSDDLLSFSVALEQANSSGLYDQALSIALMSADQSKMLRVARDWAKSGYYKEAVKWADGKLDKKSYFNLAQYAVTLARRKNENFLESLMGDYRGEYIAFHKQVETITGEVIVSDADIVAALNKLGGTGFLPISIVDVAVPFVVPRLSQVQMVDLVKTLSKSDKKNESLMLVTRIWKTLLQETGNRAYIEQVTDGLIGMMQNRDKNFRPNPEDFYSSFIPAEFEEIHIPSIRKVADFWRKNNNLKIDMVTPLFLLKQGKKDQAIDAFIKVNIDLGNIDRSKLDNAYRFLMTAFLPTHVEALKSRLEEMEKRDGLTPDLIMMMQKFFYGEYFYEGYKRNDDQNIAFMEKIASLYPENQTYLGRLYDRYMRQGRTVYALKVAERLFELDPENMFYRAGLLVSLIMLDDPLKAKEINDKIPQDLWEKGFFTELKEQIYRDGLPKINFLIFPDINPLVTGAVPVTTRSSYQYIQKIAAAQFTQKIAFVY